MDLCVAVRVYVEGFEETASLTGNDLNYSLGKFSGCSSKLIFFFEQLVLNSSFMLVWNDMVIINGVQSISEIEQIKFHN